MKVYQKKNILTYKLG